MNSLPYLLHGWSWNPAALVGIGALTAVYAKFVGRRGRVGYFVAAMALLALAMFSPLSLLADGVLFSAHMTQHILLLLFIPGLTLLSLPADFSVASGRSSEARTARSSAPVGATSVLGWIAGVGAMWFWHVPQLCNAAASTSSIHALQTVSLLGMGSVFWWPILAPRAADRLVPGFGIAYLFTACLACTALGILLTLSSVEVCSAFTAPTAAPSLWASLRDTLGARRDQQIGGLLMWLPMCLVYVAAIVLELARWLGEPATPLATNRSRS